jgi:hypothetical protein
MSEKTKFWILLGLLVISLALLWYLNDTSGKLFIAPR